MEEKRFIAEGRRPENFSYILPLLISLKQPDEDSYPWNQWYLKDNRVKIWIVNFVSNDIQYMIIRKETAKDMWLVLE